MGHTFTITERPDLGGFRPRSGKGQVFKWSSQNQNIPQGAWEFGGQLRTNRINYPGTDRPTEQVLGPNYTPFTLTGRWKNKFNRAPVGEGQESPVPGAEGNNYAENEMRLFETMCRRGNVIEIQFQGITITGLITEWTFLYKRRWDIGYSFTFSPHTKGGQDEIAFTQDQKPMSSPKRLADLTKKKVLAYIKESERQGQMNSTSSRPITLTKEEARPLFGRKPPFGGLPSGILLSANSDISDVNNQVASLSAVVDQRVLALDTEEALSISAAITQTNLIIRKTYALAQVSGSLKGSTSLLYRNPIDELNFEVWNKGRGVFARDLITSVKDTRDELIRREKPDAIALYRPFEGETLYSISQRFYKDFRSWKLIYNRNSLDYTVMKGDELLIIPSAPKK